MTLRFGNNGFVRVTVGGKTMEQPLPTDLTNGNLTFSRGASVMGPSGSPDALFEFDNVTCNVIP